jgi:hypothetical protein
MFNKKTETQPTTTTSTESTDDRKKVETLVDELLDKVMGGAELCQHCNQSCGDCVQV